MFNSLRIGKRENNEELVEVVKVKKSVLSPASIRSQSPIWQKFSARRVLENPIALMKQRKETRNKIIDIVRKILKTISLSPF